MRPTFWTSIVLACFASKAFAVVDANSVANTSDPNDGSPWANVGSVNGASGEYLGNGWVLTANHVGAGAISFDGGTTYYQPDGWSVRLTNPSDGSPTDMVLFHLATAPSSLASLPIVTSTPVAGSAVDMVGFGHIAGSAQQTYTTASGTYTGFDWSPSGTKSYGTNKIALFNVNGTNTTVFTQVDLGNGTLQVFGLPFVPSGYYSTADEGMVSTGDSGGAIFYKNGATWQLAGMIDARGTLPNQPDNTAVYGNVSYCADIATYSSQMLSLYSAPNGGGIWNGTTNPTWATTSNWSNSAAPGTGNTATFNGGGNSRTTLSLGGGVTINTVIFDTASVASYIIGGGGVGSETLTLNNGGTITVSSTVTNGQLFNAAIVLGTERSAQTYTIANNSTQAGATLTLAGNISGAASGGTAGAKTLAVTGPGITTISGVIADGGATSVALYKYDAGTLTLTGANTYTGGTILGGGILNANGDAALGGLSGTVTISNGATLQAGGAITSNRSFSLGGGGATIDTNGNTVSLAGALSGTTLTKVGSGTLNLNGTQAYTTLTTSVGTTNIESALGTGGSTVNANGTTNFMASQTLGALNIGSASLAGFGGAPAFAGSISAAAVAPEPGTIGLLLVGACGLMRRPRRG